MTEYSAGDGGENAVSEAVFNYTFDRDTEIAGYLKLRLWVGAQGADDMDCS